MSQTEPISLDVCNNSFAGNFACLEAQSQHFRQADTNLANPRTSAWFMKSLRQPIRFNKSHSTARNVELLPSVNQKGRMLTVQSRREHGERRSLKCKQGAQ
eukprot:1154187-Pelagomonas_calceolata.AAC.2